MNSKTNTLINPVAKPLPASMTAVSGNQFLEDNTGNELVNYLPVQRKLSVGTPDDPLEQEADDMAGKVMRMPEQNFIQRKCAHCEEEEKAQRKPLSSFIQRKEAGGGTFASETVSNQINSSRGKGNKIDAASRSFMENRFGADFTAIKIHTDSEAIQMNRELNAKAFTLGNDIYFNEGQYQPGSDYGNHLLAHELTHTLQQTPAIRRDPDERLPTGTYPEVHLDSDSAELIITRAQEGLGDFSLSGGVDEPASLIPPVLGVPSALPPASFVLRVAYDDRCNRTIQGADLRFSQQLTDDRGFTRGDPLRTLGGSLGLRFGDVRADGSVEASFNGSGLQALSFLANFTFGVSTAIPDECKTKKPPGVGDHGGGGDVTLSDICAGIDCDQPRTLRNAHRFLLCCIGRPPRTPEPQQLSPRTIYFYYDTPIFKSASNDTLLMVLDIMRMLPSVHVQITGHTSMEGTMLYNQDLSQRRGDAVKDYLVIQGIDSSRIDVLAMGENVPAVAEPPEPRPRTLRLPQQEAVRDLNRRAEVVFYDPSGKLSFLPTSVPFTLTVPDLSLRIPGGPGTGRFLQPPHLRWGTEEQ